MLGGFGAVVVASEHPKGVRSLMRGLQMGIGHFGGATLHRRGDREHVEKGMFP